MEDLNLPIRKIGERNWVENLTAFLQKRGVEVKSLPDDDLIQQTKEKLACSLPADLVAYYRYFGGIENPDFMPAFYPINDLVLLAGSMWEFVNKDFPGDFTEKFIVFATAPGSDPVCISKETGEIYLFSHDPLTGEKVYNDFSDYLLGEIVNMKEYILGEMEFEDSRGKQEFMERLLPGDNINYQLRHIKLG